MVREGRGNVADRDAEARERVRSHPETHCVLAGAEDGYLADTRHAAHRIVDVDVCVIGEKRRVISSLGRIKGEQRQRARGRFANRDTLVADVKRELRFGLKVTHLREDLVGVCVCADVEIDPQPHESATGVDGGHVEHVVDALHLLLDRRCHRLLDGFGIGADVGRLQKDFRRRELGILSDRQPHDRNDADDHQQDGNDDRNDRVVHEKFGHILPRLRVGCGRGFGFGHRFERLRVDRHARFHPLDPLGDDSLARLQPLLNDPK